MEGLYAEHQTERYRIVNVSRPHILCNWGDLVQALTTGM